MSLRSPWLVSFVFAVAAIEYVILVAIDPSPRFRIFWAVCAVLWMAISAVFAGLAKHVELPSEEADEQPEARTPDSRAA